MPKVRDVSSRPIKNGFIVEHFVEPTNDKSSFGERKEQFFPDGDSAAKEMVSLMGKTKKDRNFKR